ncbi:MAG: CBS domain-containing protein [Gammaproteobacteria bacterium]|nr:CBS domain-containing protein [Gammaproteobacteria bacterium]
MEENKGKQEGKGWLGRLSQVLQAEPQDREQLISLLRDAQSRDLLGADALAMIEGAMLVSEQNVRDIMVPRGQMVVVQRDVPIQDILKVIVDSGHSRFPVVTDDKDEVSGILLAKDLLHFYANEDSRFSIREYLRPVVYIPESKRLNTLLAEFRASRNHMAIVVDEYGGVSGLVTIEDVLEQIVGDIDDEHDTDLGSNIFKHDEDLYVLRAMTSIDEFNEYFSAGLPSESFETLAGMIMSELGHMPRRLEEVAIGDFHFKVLRADNRRIYMLQLQICRADEDAA